MNGDVDHVGFVLDRPRRDEADDLLATQGDEAGALCVFQFVLKRLRTPWRLLAGALTLTFFVYIFVNIAMVSGLLPVVGVPLPLVSYGGTSALTLMASFGIIMAIRTERAW